MKAFLACGVLAWGLLLSLPCPAQAQEQPGPATVDASATAAPRTPVYEVAVGSRKLYLPAPEGFQRIDGLDAKVDAVVNAALPAANRYLARFDPVGGKPPTGVGRSFNAQVLRSQESVEIGETTFAGYKQQERDALEAMRSDLEAKIAKVGEDATRNVSDELNLDVALTLSQSAVLGYFGDSPSCLGFSLAMNVSAQGRGANLKPSRMVIACLILPVNGRLIYLYAMSDLHSPQDQQWAEEAAMTWRDRILAINERVAGPPPQRAPASSRIVQGAARGAMIGAVVGIVIALGLSMLGFAGARKKRR